MSDITADVFWRHRRAGLARNWWALVIRGLIAVVFAALAFLSPALTLGSLVLVFGAYAFVDGIFAIIAAGRAAAAHERWGLLLAEGVVGVGVGLASFAMPGLAIVVIVTLIAAWAIVSGALMLASAFRLDARHGHWLMGLGGAVSIVWGIALWLWPIAGAVVLTVWLGAYALIFGVSMIALGLRLRACHRGA
jgi:uncharacterized membrane protein HdeD (DUF308 family)